MEPLVDSHCHLDFKKFDRDRPAVVAAAEEAGVVAIINPGVSLATSRAAVALAEEYPLVYAAVGVHPHDAKDVSGRTIGDLRQLAGHPKVVAIGEIGLDYYRDRSPRSDQRRAFAAQLELAAELSLPVIVHNREAAEDTFAALESWVAGGDDRRGVLHSYSAGVQWLEKTLELGFYLGISGPVTFPQAYALHRVARKVPLDRLIIETDAPFLTPVPFRGQRNQPAFVKYVAQKITDLRKKAVGEQTTRNVFELFSIDRNST